MIQPSSYQLDLNRPPGPPPRPGLAWKEETHRWIRPEGLESSEESSSKPGVNAEIGQQDPGAVKQADMYFPDLDWRSLASEAFGIGVPGYATAVTMLRVNPGMAVPRMLIATAILFNGEKVGHIARVLDGDTVKHESFYIDDAHQNKGIAADMLERMEDAYIKHGFKSITLTANDSVGGYAWARQGFDFANDDIRSEVDNEAHEDIQAYGRNNGLDDDDIDELIEEYHTLEHSWDIAAWNPTNATPGEHLGKGILLGSSWWGVKALDVDSASYKIGRMYRDARREHAR